MKETEHHHWVDRDLATAKGNGLDLRPDPRLYRNQRGLSFVKIVLSRRCALDDVDGRVLFAQRPPRQIHGRWSLGSFPAAGPEAGARHDAKCPMPSSSWAARADQARLSGVSPASHLPPG